MDGATLRLLDSLRGVSYPGGPHTRSALEAFARLLFGRPTTTEDHSWLETLAAGAELCWNGARDEPFRLIYQAVVARGHRIDLTDDGAGGAALALEGLMSLPLRERAVLATSCVLGFTAEEVGRIIGTDAGNARALVDAAIALIRREAGVAPTRERRTATPAA
jgi:hypothetical protein